jgi:uncharacterized protein with HEPN domain
MRNRLIHGYDDVDYNILWKTVASNLPRLIEALEGLLEQKMRFPVRMPDETGGPCLQSLGF